MHERSRPICTWNGQNHFCTKNRENLFVFLNDQRTVLRTFKRSSLRLDRSNSAIGVEMLKNTLKSVVHIFPSIYALQSCI